MMLPWDDAYSAEEPGTGRRRGRSRSRSRGRARSRSRSLDQLGKHEPILYLIGEREQNLETLQKGEAGNLYLGASQNLGKRLGYHEKGWCSSTKPVVVRHKRWKSRQGQGGIAGDTWMLLGVIQGFGAYNREGWSRARSLEEAIHVVSVGGTARWEGGFWALRDHVGQTIAGFRAGQARGMAGWGLAAPYLARNLSIKWFLGEDMGQGRSAIGVREAWEAQEAWKEQFLVSPA